MAARTPVLGKAVAGGGQVAIDVPRLIASRALIQANSGGGKSYALRRILEQTHGQVQQLVIDPEGEFASLRERFDFILAAPQGGDCPAEVRSAPLLARRLLELGVSAIVNIYELAPAARADFVARFLHALINAPRRLWHPALIVLDEAQDFCPQKGRSESRAAVIDLMARGRKRGFAGVLATQRVSKLDKDAAAECGSKIIGLCNLPADRDRAADLLGLPTADRAKLQTLDPGGFFVVGPALSRQILELKVGPVKTTHPEPGQTIPPPPAPSGAVKALLAQLADLPAAAAAEAETVNELRARIGQLERELKQAKKAAPAPAPTAPSKTIEVPVTPITPQMIDSLESLAQRGQQAATLAQHRALDLQKLAKDAREALGRIEGGRMPFGRDDQAEAARVEAMRAKGRARPSTRARAAAAAEATAADGRRRPAPRQRILDQLATLEAMGISPLDRRQLALFVGQSPRSSGYANNLGALRSAGLISYPAPQQVELTGQGRKAAAAVTAPATTEELHRLVRDHVSGPQWGILLVLIAIYPNDIGRYALADRVGASAKSSGYANNLGALRTLGLIDYPAPGQVVASKLLFLGG